MGHPDFEIEIITQGWVGEAPEQIENDLCSHGDVRIAIGGRTVAPGAGKGDYTISTSALALLRTLESDHSPERRVAERLVLCCGMLSMLTCPIGIDWSVSHLGGRVRLHDVVRYDGTDESKAVLFPGLAVELEEAEYRCQVVSFATQAKQLFEDVEKVPADDFEAQDYERFWQEYDVRLGRAARSR
jgi:hypothetical protein